MEQIITKSPDFKPGFIVSIRRSGPYRHIGWRQSVEARQLHVETASPLKQIDEPPEATPRFSVKRLRSRLMTRIREFSAQNKPNICVRSSPFGRRYLLAGQVEIKHSSPDMIRQPRREKELSPLFRKGGLPRQLIERPPGRNEAPGQDRAARSVVVPSAIQKAPEPFEGAFDLECADAFDVSREAREGADPGESSDLFHAKGRFRERIEIGSVLCIEVCPGEGPHQDLPGPDHLDQV